MSNQNRIAILGATGHIAKGLIVNFDESREYELSLFARNCSHVRVFLETQGCRDCSIFDDFSKLSQGRFDVVLNCIVNRDPADPTRGFDDTLFTTMEYYDNLILDYLRENPNCRYINFSSGAVYGGTFESPVTEETQAIIPINRLTPIDYYQAVKLYSETKHRALSEMNIVDIRIFSYFSRFLDVNSRFLLAKMISCVKQGKVFETDAIDIYRDFTHPKDLFQLVEICLKNPINRTFDLYSAKPASKFELIRRFETDFGLKCRIIENKIQNVKTGIKPVYYSNDRSAAKFGYVPEFTAIEAVLQETKKMLQ
jgi:nucleoside-diphosphate-sugar epimerase